MWISTGICIAKLFRGDKCGCQLLSSMVLFLCLDGRGAVLSNDLWF